MTTIPQATAVAAGPASALPDSAAPQPAARPVAPAASPVKLAEPSTVDLKAAAAKVGQAMALSSPDTMEFSIDKNTGKSVVRIMDSNTGKLIQQIPSEQMMEIAQSIGKTQGLLLNQKA